MKERTIRNSFRSLGTLTFSLLTGLSVLLSFHSRESAMEVQNLLAVMAGCVLGGVNGSSSAGIFLMAGIAGLPLFPGFEKGFESFTAADGGWLWGYFTGALAAGLILKHPSPFERKDKGIWIRTILAVTAGLFFSYIPGLLWYIKSSGENPGLIIQRHLLKLNLQLGKAAVCTASSIILRPLAAKLMYPGLESALKEEEELMEKLRSYNQKKNRRKEK
ncbi:biotin transporter BioY [Treponema sp.]|uniref:biotin transporter BioY n=1 Tax=Treponema sp. TaxID=166 RepID=UPI0025CEA5E0|nr:biotin transporter BioY [Treponema sp.]MCR5218768.1 biotin transporter BioY [Treponema sp.]